MSLSRQVIKQFANITDVSTPGNNEATVYATVVEVEDSIGSGGLLTGKVRIDGSTELTPITSTVKMAAGNRVIVRLKNHSAVVMSNINDPSASYIQVTDQGILITKCVTFESLEKGETTIDGACIKTGKISAERIDLTSTSQFSVDGQSNWHSSMTSSDNWRRDSTGEVDENGDIIWGPPYKFRGTDGVSPYYSFITSTHIDGTSVQSPVLRGGIISGAVFSNLKGTVNNPSYTHCLVLGDDQQYGDGVLGIYRSDDATELGDDNMMFSVTTGFLQNIATLNGPGKTPFAIIVPRYQDGEYIADVTAVGRWDFQFATEVTGIHAVFK